MFLSNQNSLQQAQPVNREAYKINDKFSIKVIQALDEFENLKAIWNSLAEGHGLYTPWLSWDWFNLCLKHFLDWDKLLILVFCEGDKTIAIAPFVLKNERFRGTFWTKKIEFLGCAHSPVRNIIFADLDEDNRKSILSSIISYFRTEYKSWDIIELDTILGKNHFSNSFDEVISNSGLEYRTYFCFNNSYLNEIKYNFNQYFENLPKNLHRNVQRYEKKLKGIGKLRFEMRTNDEDIDYYLDLYDEIRAKSWKAVERDKIFNREFVRYTAKKGWIRLSFLYVDTVPVAAAKYLVWDKTAFGIDSIYDESYAKFSPGGVLTSKIFQYVIDIDRVSEIDLGRGDEPYKMEWVAYKKEIKGITVFSHTLKGRLLEYLILKLLPTVEKNEKLLATKNKLVGFLKEHRQK
jgi:CelD/BcsL family acetyltransferase involved in cellulose biosynthesis